MEHGEVEYKVGSNVTTTGGISKTQVGYRTRPINRHSDFSTGWLEYR